MKKFEPPAGPRYETLQIPGGYLEKQTIPAPYCIVVAPRSDLRSGRMVGGPTRKVEVNYLRGTVQRPRPFLQAMPGNS